MYTGLIKSKEYISKITFLLNEIQEMEDSFITENLKEILTDFYGIERNDFEQVKVEFTEEINEYINTLNEIKQLLNK